MGWCDRQCRLVFALALWNRKDPFIKERLFGLGGPDGNHGEDVKECYYYLDATPTHAYAKGLYKYPQVEFPYARLIEENARRGRECPEFELTDTGIFMKGATSTCLWSTRNIILMTWPFGLRSRTADRNPLVSMFCRRFGFVIPGLGAANTSIPRERLSKAAAEFHLVGQSEGSRGAQLVFRRLSWARQHWHNLIVRSRCPPADTFSRLTAPLGWDFTALRCWRWP